MLIDNYWQCTYARKEIRDRIAKIRRVFRRSKKINK